MIRESEDLHANRGQSPAEKNNVRNLKVKGSGELPLFFGKQGQGSVNPKSDSHWFTALGYR